VVSDQTGNPTSAIDLADAIFTVIGRWRQSPELGLGETFHFAGKGQTSWAGLAERAFRISEEAGGPTAEIVRIAADQWPTAALRPRNSALDCRKFESCFGHSAPAWNLSIEPVVRRVLAQRDQEMG
jgi:dTDP-4-dehydrorhamnose reductase